MIKHYAVAVIDFLGQVPNVLNWYFGGDFNQGGGRETTSVSLPPLKCRMLILLRDRSALQHYANNGGVRVL